MEESAAIHLLKKAVNFDTEKRFNEALVCYTEGIELLLKALKGITDEKKKSVFRDKICEYIKRAEKVKQIVEEIKQSGKYHEQIQIEENSIGNSYEKLFSRFFNDDSVDFVEIIDPYIRKRHQIHNFLKFCEMIVKLSKNVKSIVLHTIQEEASGVDQVERLNEIKESLVKRSIKLEFQFNKLLHDREIKLSNGWIIKIGRGLDYFKAPESMNGSLCVGLHDLDLRQCYSTTIDIFHQAGTTKTIKE